VPPAAAAAAAAIVALRAAPATGSRRAMTSSSDAQRRATRRAGDDELGENVDEILQVRSSHCFILYCRLAYVPILPACKWLAPFAADV